MNIWFAFFNGMHVHQLIRLAFIQIIFIQFIHFQIIIDDEDDDDEMITIFDYENLI